MTLVPEKILHTKAINRLHAPVIDTTPSYQSARLPLQLSSHNKPLQPSQQQDPSQPAKVTNLGRHMPTSKEPKTLIHIITPTQHPRATPSRRPLKSEHSPSCQPGSPSPHEALEHSSESSPCTNLQTSLPDIPRHYRYRKIESAPCGHK